MRSLIACLLAACLTASATANVEFVRVWPQWQEAAVFDRIGEYFGGKENAGRELAFRTQAGERAGLYFLVRVKSDDVIDAAKFVVEVIRPDSPDAKAYTFPVTLGAKNRVVHLGLTGSDWPGGAEVHPVAWKLTLLDAHDRPLTSRASFLWEQPAK